MAKRTFRLPSERTKLSRRSLGFGPLALMSSTAYAIPAQRPSLSLAAAGHKLQPRADTTAATEPAEMRAHAQPDRRRTRHDDLHRRAQAQAAAKPETSPGHGCALSPQAVRPSPAALPLDCGWERRMGAFLRQAEGGHLALLRRAHPAGVAEAENSGPSTSDGATLP